MAATPEAVEPHKDVSQQVAAPGQGTVSPGELKPRNPLPEMRAPRALQSSRAATGAAVALRVLRAQRQNLLGSTIPATARVWLRLLGTTEVPPVLVRPG